MNPENLDLSTLPALALEARKELPAVSGIYFVRNASGEVVYIGRAVNLRQRWETHHRARQLKSFTGITIAWLAVEDQALLGEIEAACITHYAPPLNGSTAREEGDRDAILLRIPVELYHEVSAWAKEDERSMNNLILRIIKQAVQDRHA